MHSLAAAHYLGTKDKKALLCCSTFYSQIYSEVTVTAPKFLLVQYNKHKNVCNPLACRICWIAKSFLSMVKKKNEVLTVSLFLFFFFHVLVLRIMHLGRIHITSKPLSPQVSQSLRLGSANADVFFIQTHADCALAYNLVH